MANVQNVIAIPIIPEQPKNVPEQQLFVYVNKDLTGGRYFSGNAITGLSTTPTAYSSSGISEAIVGDVYINTTGQMYICTLGGDANTALWKYSGVTLAGSKVYFGGWIRDEIITPSVYVNSGITWANVGDIYINNGDGVSDSLGNMYECVLAGNANTAQWVYKANVTGLKHNTISGEYILVAEFRHNQQYTYKTASNNIKIVFQGTVFNGYISEINFITGNNPSFTINDAVTYPIKYFVRGNFVDSYTPPANTEIDMLIRYNGENMLCVILEIPQ